jgi:hypothetical protein
MRLHQDRVSDGYISREPSFDVDMTTLLPPPQVVSRPAPRLVDEPGVRFGIAHGGVLLAAFAAAALSLDPAWALGLLGLTAFAAGFALSPTWASGLGISAWAFYTGFLENDLGQLTLSAADLLHLGALVCLGAIGSLLGRWRGRRV